MSQYEAIFSELAGKLSDIGTEVARRFEVSSYYECCDRMGAYMRDGEIVEDDSVGMHFERDEFDVGLWKEHDVDWIGSGNALSDMLVQVPLGRQMLARLYAEENCWIEFEVAIFLGLCSAGDTPQDSPCLLVSPQLTFFQSGANSRQPLRAANQAALCLELLDSAPSRFRAYIQELIPHLGDVRCERLSAATCMKWLGFGSPPGLEFADTVLWDDFPAIVSAPVGTLAAYIQSNLAYSDSTGKPGVRLDRLLYADAQRKVQQLRTLLDLKGAEYNAALRHAFSSELLK